MADREDATLLAIESLDGSSARQVPVEEGRASAAPSTLLPGSGERERLAGRYEILGLLGSGGMGTVYRVRDLELDEIVALKVMRPELLTTPGILERFRREAKLARRVTHHNVARVFDIGEHGGEKFLTMEYVEGDSLSTVIARQGAFPVERAITVALAVAAGLGGAHAAGVVHRDLKPDNVIIAADGRVVLTDFGIARAIADERAGSAGGVTNTLGVFVGTPAYMAPEQVEGRPLIDARADIYAFGALLYELLTGHRAWPGDVPLGVATARLLHPPPDPRRRRPSLPPALADLVLRCLARAPEDRPATLAEVAAALSDIKTGGTLSNGIPAPTPSRPVAAPTGFPAPTPSRPPTASTGLPVSGTPAPTPTEKTVAVLPFRNGGGADDDYLAEELTDDLLDALSMTRGLRVRARGAVLKYRGADADPREIGRELGVQVVVEGSVRRGGGRVRVSARLVSVADGFQVWAKRFDRPEQDVLSINDEVARAIAEALTLDGHGLPERARDAPSDPRAIDLYLRARHEYRQFWPDKVQRSVALYEEALHLAPEDPLLLSGMALSLARLSFFFGDAGIARARQVAERAVSVAPHLGDAHLALGSVLFQVGEAPGAVRAFRAALARAPRLAEANASLGRILTEAGAVDEGLRRLHTAISLDPEVPLVLPEMVRTYALLGRWDKSDEAIEKMLGIDANRGYWMLRARTALWRGDPALLEQALAAVPLDAAEARFPRLLLHVVRTGQLPSELFALQKEELAGGVRRQSFVLQIECEVLCYLGHIDTAVEVLRRAAEIGLSDQLWLDRCPLLEKLRQDPRFGAIRADVKRRTDAILAAATAS